MRISDWSSDVCSSDLFADLVGVDLDGDQARREVGKLRARRGQRTGHLAEDVQAALLGLGQRDLHDFLGDALDLDVHLQGGDAALGAGHLEVHVAEVILVAEDVGQHDEVVRSEEHTSELQSLMRNSYAVFCLKKKTNNI